MRHTLTAIMITAVTCGALLAGAMLAMDAWHWRLHFESQALQSAGLGSDAVVVENPFYSPEESVFTYVLVFIAWCAASTFWVVFLVIPSLLASRRVFSDALASHIIAA